MLEDIKDALSNYRRKIMHLKMYDGKLEKWLKSLEVG